jgi:hypothetical protein
VGDHLALALGIERHFADREPFAELEMRQAMTSFLVNGPPSASDQSRGSEDNRQYNPKYNLFEWAFVGIVLMQIDFDPAEAGTLGGTCALEP